MTLFQLKTFFNNRLSDIYPQNEIDAIFSLICWRLLNYSKIEIHTKKDTDVAKDIEANMIEILSRLFNSEPIQYILGSVEFYNINLQIDRRALIPRQETELLVDIAFNDFQHSQNIKIIDLCTGSGCIAIAFASIFKEAKVTATDISKEALELAQSNAMRNKAKISFLLDSILDPKYSYETFDIIICNPPYVRESEINKMEKNVIDYEPHNALFVSDSDPLLFYKAIAGFAKEHLNEKGTVYCEFNEAFGPETAEIFVNSGFINTMVLKDLNNKDRFIKAKRI